MFEIQKSGDKTSSGEIGLDIRTHASHENVLENSVVKIDKDPLCNFLFYPSYKYDLCRGNVFTNIQTWKKILFYLISRPYKIPLKIIKISEIFLYKM